MKNLSLKLEDNIYQETEKVLSTLKKPRNRYINEALDFYNKLQHKNALSKKLEEESVLVSQESMKVLREFEKFEYEATTI